MPTRLHIAESSQSTFTKIVLPTIKILRYRSSTRSDVRFIASTFIGDRSCSTSAQIESRIMRHPASRFARPGLSPDTLSLPETGGNSALAEFDKRFGHFAWNLSCPSDFVHRENANPPKAYP